MEAIKVLRTAEEALNLLEIEEDVTRFKIEYYAAMSALRSVGHVFDKVDSCNDCILNKKKEKWWNDIKNHKDENAIFYQFINYERNQLLKEGVINYEENNGNYIIDLGNGVILSHELCNDLMFVPVDTGKYAGEDVRDMIRMGIEWWKEQFVILGINPN